MLHIDFSKDYYRILGVSYSASEADIRRAYHVLARQWHPDMHVGESQYKRAFAEEWFKIINEAYDVLSDPSKKEIYDAVCSTKHSTQPQTEAQTSWQYPPQNTWSYSRSKTNTYAHAWQTREYVRMQRHSQQTTETRKRNGDGNENAIILSVVIICVVLYGLICWLTG